MKKKNVKKGLLPYVVLLAVVLIVTYVITFGGSKVNDITYDKLISELKQERDVTPIVQFVEAGSLPVSEGKAKRVIDLRAKK